MVQGIAQKARELLEELLSRDRDSLSEWNDAKLQAALQEVSEHFKLFESYVEEVSASERRRQGLGEHEDVACDWGQYRDYTTSILIHHDVICRNKTVLIALVNERLRRLRGFWWRQRRIPEAEKDHLSPAEHQVYDAYARMQTRYYREVGLDLTLDMDPPREPLVQVQCLVDANEVMMSVGRVVLKRNSVHLLPQEEAQPLVRQGILEYL